MSNTILLVGCGNMGFAMLTGWLAQDPGHEVHVVEPAEALHARAAGAGAQVVSDLDQLPADLAPDLVILAVKPPLVAGVLSRAARLAETGATFVSVAAGIPMAQMAAALPVEAPLIRCMPNTPAAIGQGMLVLCAGPGVSQTARDLTQTLFSASGAVTWIEDEALMDAVTAISGSGPAYVFHFVEALTEAGVALGLPQDTALQLAKQTVAGAGQLVATSATPPATLREQVTSPNGTTAAALAVLMAEEGLSPLLAKATRAARDRGVELGKGG